jgi:hypothetical protein
VNIIQNNGVIFLTLYVYGNDSLPRWYFASGMTATSASTFSGPLYRSTGPSFAVPWDPARFQFDTAGTATLSFSSVGAGTLTYTVDNVQVTKPISRISLAADNFAGVYLGGLTATASGCSVATNGVFIANRLTIQHSTSSPRFTVDTFSSAGSPASCVFQGTYAQQGRMGTIANGTWSCSGAFNNAGTFTMTEMSGSQNGFTAKFQGRDQYCQSYTGYFGGLRDVQ